MKKKEWFSLGVMAASMIAIGLGTAWAGGFLTNGVPPAGGTQYPTTIPLTGNEAFPGDTNLPAGQNPQSEAVTTNMLADYAAGAAINGSASLLPAGDATLSTYPWGTAGVSTTTTVTYQTANLFIWSGTNTAVTLAKDTTAGDLATGFTTAYKFAETNAQTGLVQACTGYELPTSRTRSLAGKAVELNFWATAGATFAANTNGQLQVYLITGTAADEGSAKMAFGLNAGGGGGSAWTGQTNIAAVNVPISTTSTRYNVIGLVPANAIELGFAICFTPTATAGANNYVALSGVQLDQNAGAASFAGQGGLASAFPTKAFVYQDPVWAIEAQNYSVYSVAEPAGATGVATGTNHSTSTCYVVVPFPMPMRVAPTFTASGTALSGSTWKVESAGTTTALATTFIVTNTANTTTNAYMTVTVTGTPLTVGDACNLVGAGGGSILTWSAAL